MYHLLRLTVKDCTAQKVQTILTQILLVEGPAKQRAIDNAARYVDDRTNSYDECFDGDIFECRDPASVKLGKNVSLEVSYKEEIA